MTQPCCNKEKFHRDILQACKYLNHWRVNKPEQALELMQPYANCACVEGFDEAKYQCRIGLIFSMIGDCYQAMEKFEAAAGWYARAALKSDFRGFGMIYADMVVKRKLCDHYVVALQSFRNEIAWEKQNFGWTARLKYAQTILQRGAWLEPDFWRLNLQKRALLRRLEKLVATQESENTNCDNLR